MSLEQELRFDISRCSLCPLAAYRRFFTPTILAQSDSMLVLDFPSKVVCDSNNAWKQGSASFLSKALLHSSGGDLNRFHLTFTGKCLPRLDEVVPPQRERMEWARVCASEYLSREIRGVLPSKVLLFGEAVVKTCFPDLETPWEKLVGGRQLLPGLEVEAHFLESPSRYQRMGLSSPEGLSWIQSLHEILGGQLSLPDEEQEGEDFSWL
jgi:uracil-DNA glycosylase